MPAAHGSWVYSRQTPEKISSIFISKKLSNVTLQNLPMFAAVGAAASCVASVTTETSNGEVQSKDK